MVESCRERLLQLLIEECAALRWGDPLLEQTAIGPLVNALSSDRVAGVLERADARCGPTYRPHGRDTSLRGDRQRVAGTRPRLCAATTPGSRLFRKRASAPCSSSRPRETGTTRSDCATASGKGLSPPC